MEICFYSVIVVFLTVIPTKYMCVHVSSGWFNHNSCICDGEFLGVLHEGSVSLF